MKSATISSYYTVPGLGMPQNTVEFITHQVAEYFCISINDMCDKSRKRIYLWPRQLAMALIKKHTVLTLAEIGHQMAKVGNVSTPYDHTTVIHSVKKVNEIISVSKSDAQTFRILNNYVLNASNDMLQLIVREVAKSFGVAPVMVLNVNMKKTHQYRAVCAAIWLMQNVNKTSTHQLSKQFNAPPDYIRAALLDRIDFCNKDAAYFSKIMRLKKIIFGLKN